MIESLLQTCKEQRQPYTTSNLTLLIES
jgi:hypothetical protein